MVDFWESGVTKEWVSVLHSVTTRLVVLTLLRRLLAETLAEVVRHVDLWVGLVGLVGLVWRL